MWCMSCSTLLFSALWARCVTGDQPAHLRVKDRHQGFDNYPSEVSIKKFAGPEQRFCPAGNKRTVVHSSAAHA